MTTFDLDGCLRCSACELAATRHKVVVGRGNPVAPLMLIGEAPGAQEDQSGVPFTGRSGQVLDRLLIEAGFKIERDLYICNAVKCRPPNNRRPKKNELGAPVAEWMSSNSYGSCIKRLHSDERAAAAGFSVDEDWSAKAVRRAERAQEDPERAALERQAEAQRKRVRRIEEGKEDRDALRELANSRECDALPLEATPAGLRETAVDGTPRSAKAAGAELRQLTQSFYERLPRPALLHMYGVEHEDLESVQVSTEFWDSSDKHRQRWATGVRPLKRYGAKARKV